MSLTQYSLISTSSPLPGRDACLGDLVVGRKDAACHAHAADDLTVDRQRDAARLQVDLARKHVQDAKEALGRGLTQLRARIRALAQHHRRQRLTRGETVAV